MVLLRMVLALGVIANSILFAVGVWRSVLRGEQAFHSLGEISGVSGWLADIWLWPITLILLCILLVIPAVHKTSTDHFED